MPTTKRKKHTHTNGLQSIRPIHSIKRSAILGRFLTLCLRAFSLSYTHSHHIHIASQPLLLTCCLCQLATQFIGHFDIFRSHLIIMIRRHRHIARVSRLSDHFTASYSSNVSLSLPLRLLLFGSFSASTSRVLFFKFTNIIYL